MQLDGPPSPEARAPASPPSPTGGDDVAGEFLSDEVVRTRLASMTAAEGDYAVVPHDYMTTVQRHGMTADWRTKIYTWYGQLTESFALSETCWECALNFLDRYLCATPRVKSCTGVNFQLLSVACLFLATKVEEPRPITTADFVALSEGVFAAEDVRLMELDLLCTLEWKIHPPTVAAFCELLAALVGGRAAAPRAAAIAATARGLGRRALADPAFLAYPPSMVAVNATICAMKQHGLGPSDVGRGWRASGAARSPTRRAATRRGASSTAARGSSASPAPTPTPTPRSRRRARRQGAGAGDDRRSPDGVTADVAAERGEATRDDDAAAA
ncbi:cyclin-A,F-box protein 1 [Aureococcus anophagefferens]|uniref:Cyclin-A,F-box protein 1 n=1 Tax=Aureococcus anophagefferens TaxID=44056 RepID=A0ABR1G342_AURAN